MTALSGAQRDKVKRFHGGLSNYVYPNVGLFEACEYREVWPPVCMPDAKNLIVSIFKFFFANITNLACDMTNKIVNKDGRPEHVRNQEIWQSEPHRNIIYPIIFHR
jgi:hypothetical protein